MQRRNAGKVLVVYTLEPWDHALTYLRYRAPAEMLGWKVLNGRTGEVVHFDLIRESDLVLIQRVFPHWRAAYQRVVEEARSLRKPVIYEIDDLLIALPSDHPCVDWYRPALEDILIGSMQADRVVVSSKSLRQIFSIFNQDTQLWPAYLPDNMWRLREIKPSNGKSLRIGYMGGITHVPDLDSIVPVLNRLVEEWNDRIELHFWGCKPSGQLKGNVFVHYIEEKIDYREFIATFSEAQADIWIAPLQDSIFNRCKSSIKYWEYAAVGGAGVFSNLEPYREIVESEQNGFLAADRQDWYAILTRLITDSALRSSIARNAGKTLERYGRMSLHLKEWEEIYTTARSKADLIHPRSPIQEAFLRFAEQLRERSEEKEGVIRRLGGELESQKQHIQQLELRSRYLDAVLNSRSWRLIQSVGKIRRLLFGWPEVSRD
ncbi:MAG: glycosyltransferase [Anaerolineales bacterium]|nr:glycosyltransferase [Anaerolineales bacterium]MDW8162918.1 glycosyltransferase [Anaerolineales bacterium]